MRKMGKVSVLLLSALFAAIILIPMVNLVQADIDSYIIWTGYTYKGTDSYYGTGFTIVAYLNGTTVSLKIPVKNNVAGNHINITAVGMEFDTGLNITQAMRARIDNNNMQYFEISFTANVNQLPWAHAYTIRVKIEHAGGTAEWTRDWSLFSPSYKFVVYTQDQKDIRDLAAICSAYLSSYPYSYYFNAIKACVLHSQAVAQATEASTYLSLGKFTEAKASYQTAVNLFEEAFAVEEDVGVQEEGAYLNATIKEADAAMLQAQATMNQSYGYILLGLGFVLVGVGAILYGAKKPKPTQS